VGKFAFLFFRNLQDTFCVEYLRHQKGIDKFGCKLKSIRVSRSISQEKLANDCNVEISQISRIKRGVVYTSVSMVYTLAEKLNIEPLEFFKE
jgi:ribosome-binding protein aMBF1 (putative translation factor)